MPGFYFLSITMFCKQKPQDGGQHVLQVPFTKTAELEKSRPRPWRYKVYTSNAPCQDQAAEHIPLYGNIRYVMLHDCKD